MDNNQIPFLYYDPKFLFTNDKSKKITSFEKDAQTEHFVNLMKKIKKEYASFVANIEFFNSIQNIPALTPMYKILCPPHNSTSSMIFNAYKSVYKVYHNNKRTYKLYISSSDVKVTIDYEFILSIGALLSKVLDPFFEKEMNKESNTAKSSKKPDKKDKNKQEIENKNKITFDETAMIEEFFNKNEITLVGDLPIWNGRISNYIAIFKGVKNVSFALSSIKYDREIDVNVVYFFWLFFPILFPNINKIDINLNYCHYNKVLTSTESPYKFTENNFEKLGKSISNITICMFLLVHSVSNYKKSRSLKIILNDPYLFENKMNLNEGLLEFTSERIPKITNIFLSKLMGNDYCSDIDIEFNALDPILFKNFIAFIVNFRNVYNISIKLFSGRAICKRRLLFDYLYYNKLLVEEEEGNNYISNRSYSNVQMFSRIRGKELKNFNKGNNYFRHSMKDFLNRENEKNKNKLINNQNSNIEEGVIKENIEESSNNKKSEEKNEDKDNKNELNKNDNKQVNNDNKLEEKENGRENIDKNNNLPAANCISNNSNEAKEKGKKIIFNEKDPLAPLPPQDDPSPAPLPTSQSPTPTRKPFNISNDNSKKEQVNESKTPKPEEENTMGTMGGISHKSTLNPLIKTNTTEDFVIINKYDTLFNKPKRENIDNDENNAIKREEYNKEYAQKYDILMNKEINYNHISISSNNQYYIKDEKIYEYIYDLFIENLLDLQLILFNFMKTFKSFKIDLSPNDNDNLSEYECYTSSLYFFIYNILLKISKSEINVLHIRAHNLGSNFKYLEKIYKSKINDSDIDYSENGNIQDLLLGFDNIESFIPFNKLPYKNVNELRFERISYNDFNKFSEYFFNNKAKYKYLEKISFSFGFMYNNIIPKIISFFKDCLSPSLKIIKINNEYRIGIEDIISIFQNIKDNFEKKVIVKAIKIYYEGGLKDLERYSNSNSSNEIIQKNTKILFDNILLTNKFIYSLKFLTYNTFRLKVILGGNFKEYVYPIIQIINKHKNKKKIRKTLGNKYTKKNEILKKRKILNNILSFMAEGNIKLEFTIK